MTTAAELLRNYIQFKGPEGTPAELEERIKDAKVVQHTMRVFIEQVQALEAHAQTAQVGTTSTLMYKNAADRKAERSATSNVSTGPAAMAPNANETKTTLDGLPQAEPEAADNAFDAALKNAGVKNDGPRP
jgi:hypothetical protein